jgi:Rod binding domain-containing protein
MTDPIASIDGLAGASPVSPVAKPAGVTDQRLWDTATQFENLLVRQLTQQLEDTVQPQDDSSDDSDDSDSSDDDTTVGATDATSQYYSQLLPGALADGITAGGGLGLAQQLYDALQQQQGQSSK